MKLFIQWAEPAELTIPVGHRRLGMAAEVWGLPREAACRPEHRIQLASGDEAPRIEISIQARRDR